MRVGYENDEKRVRGREGDMGWQGCGVRTLSVQFSRGFSSSVGTPSSSVGTWQARGHGTLQHMAQHRQHGRNSRHQTKAARDRPWEVCDRRAR